MVTNEMVTGPEIETRRNQALIRRLLAFGGIALFGAVAFWRPLSTLLHLAWSRDEYTHILIILPLALSLIFIDRKNIFAKLDHAPIWGLCLLILAGGLLYTSTLLPVYALTLQITALIAAWFAGFVFCFGTQAFRWASFPLFFTCLIVPLPQPALNAFVAFLQKGSAAVAFHFLEFSGIPVGRDGLILFLPNLSIKVAAECSGIRSSLVLLVTSLVLAHLFLREAWKKCVIALLVVPVMILKNGIRIFVLSFWAATVDPGILSSWVHHQGGILFFQIALAIIFLSIWLLRKIGSERGKLRRQLVFSHPSQ